MKTMIFILTGLIGISAHAGSFGYSGETVCNGSVKTPISDSSPITLEIEWGETNADLGNLPPYSIHQKQNAITTVSIDGQSGSKNMSFNQSGGTTRCEWWNQSLGMITLHGMYSYYLEFDNSWNHSGCGSHTVGVFLSDTMSGGANKMVKLDCH